MKHLFRLFAILALLTVSTGSALGNGGDPQFVGIRSYDMQHEDYWDGKVYHYGEVTNLAGGRAYICAKGSCAYYTAGADGVAGLWLPWGTQFSVTPARPLGYTQCQPWWVLGFAGTVGQSMIVSDAVWTGWCSTPDANICPAQGCGPQLSA